MENLFVLAGFRSLRVLAGVVRTVWVQRTGDAAYAQRPLPTGGVEMHFPIGGRPQLVGPLTGPEVEVIPARTTSSTSGWA